MKNKMKLSSIIISVLVFSLCTPVFAEELTSNPENGNISIDMVLTEESSGQQIKLETYEVLEPEKINTTNLRSGIQEEQFKQEVLVSIPTTDILAQSREEGTIAGDRTDQTYCLNARITIYYEQEYVINENTQGYQRRINRLDLNYTVDELGTWFTQASFGYQARGIMLLQNGMFSSVNDGEGGLLIDAAQSCNTTFYPTKNLWIYRGGEPDILKGLLSGTLYNAPRNTSWSVSCAVDVP